ncbi:estradiol 17-beta-dehydrogenase 12 [Clonorchis sinensis]|uniref:Estradiol 17-beta-dehydrogenase 12 n=1 Tax=Clonorchis sinensis TaxID=79923 RepID=G7YR36_CLOSI|nr:estradiol 17-beta-dehydrogenase 12 [Clonorchis sinensis]
MPVQRIRVPLEEETVQTTGGGILRSLQGRVHQATVRAVLYGRETWPLQTDDVRRLRILITNASEALLVLDGVNELLTSRIRRKSMTMSVQCALFSFMALLFFWKIIFPVLRIIFLYTVGKRIYSRRNQLKKAGEWAIVTGATDGIGKAYARELAKDGLNIMLISRNQEKLDKISEEIKDQFHVDTKTVACDFTQTDIYEALEQEINTLPSIACLVNNVGLSYPHFARFSDASFINIEFIRNMINCNMTSVASLTRIVLPRLLKQAGHGSAIINLSSFAGLVPFPYLSLYSASKTFIKHFVQSLIPEVGTSKVYIQAVCPVLVATTLSGVKRPRLFAPLPDTFAASALDMLGVEPVTSGYLPHALQAFVLSIHPKVAALAAQITFQKVSKRKRE